MRKAFDTVHHGRLLDKLGQIGANRSVLRWFQSYLGHREHTTFANKIMSDPIQVKYGVPQGSILGPLLFSVYINNLPNTVENSKVILYADDAVMITEDRRSDDITRIGQPDLNNILQWCATNRLTINSDKTMQVIYGTPPKTSGVIGPTLSIDNTSVERVASFCYLGVTLDENLTLKQHMGGIRKRGNYKVKQAHRIRDSIDDETALIIYKHCIMPTLEYCNFMLDSANNLDIKSIQTIQNRGLRSSLRIRNPRDITTEDLHTQCSCKTLVQRRDTQLLLHLFKLSKVAQNIIVTENPRTRADNKVRFKIGRTKLRVIKKSPLARGITLWNSLDRQTQLSETRAKFKSAIINKDFTVIKNRQANMI